ncbi:MAG: M28 family peptidase [bacterium]|nr:MAG: M28 family peptidase [bacterium]
MPEFDEDSSFRFLTEQCELGPRYPGSPEHRRLQRYLVDRLTEFGANVSLQSFDGVLTTGDTLHLINIIGNYNTGARKRLLLGAHYDTRPRADRDPDPENRDLPILGANDGASGVAVLLEIARLLGGSKPPVGVDIVFFDGEDYGEEGVAQDYILGSTYFVRHLKGYEPFAVIIVDMIGDRDLSIPKEGFSKAASSDLLEEIFSIAGRLGIEAFDETEGAAIIDDHLPFIQAGIRAVDLIDFDYPYWHTLEDTPDKCASESLGCVGRTLMTYIWAQR